MEQAKRWWIVRTDCGSIRTRAVSESKAKRNAKYRLVMGDGCHDRPTPRELAEMRDIEVLEVVAEEAERSSAIRAGAGAEGGSTRGAIRAGAGAEGGSTRGDAGAERTI